MWSAASVLVCALSVLGRAERTMPPIELIDFIPPEVSAGAEGFVRRDTGTIYLITSSPVFRDAADARELCGDSLAIKKLASVLAHEEWHLRHGADERGAYEFQLLTLLRLGVMPDNRLYWAVQRSMQHVLAVRRRNHAEIVVASGP
ncbi:MAG TPA: hypothetical protein VI485_00235 [Vicinamibacterales bacterium]|nr:hypothetical protein [Vicinamibacterales bacterium]